MRLYLVCSLVFLAGCAASDPEGSVVLKDPAKPSIIVHQVEGATFEGCAEVLLNSNVPGFLVYAKLVDLGEVELEDGGEWSVSLASTEARPRYDSDLSRLTLATAHPNGQEMPLKVCVQVTGLDPRALPYDSLRPPPRPARLYITVCPPMNP